MTTPAGWFPIRQGDPLTDSLYDSQHPFHNLQSLVPESEVTTLFLEGEYELSDNVTGYAEFLMNRRETENLGYLQIWSYIYKEMIESISNICLICNCYTITNK